MMDRRKGIIGVLAAIAGATAARAQSTQTSGVVANGLLSWKQRISLPLDNFTNDAIEVSFKGEVIEITCEEIMEALRPVQPTGRITGDAPDPTIRTPVTRKP